ncbi:hypothetical protein F5883DRAFT_249431 [Diaporthe sp. PMI_573]|nr:hypothetical protein F5883DRAFT_249431 [Diaporthaceae sp. PMI_573]
MLRIQPRLHQKRVVLLLECCSVGAICHVKVSHLLAAINHHDNNPKVCVPKRLIRPESGPACRSPLSVGLGGWAGGCY